MKRPERVRLVDLVFGLRAPERRWRLLVAALIAGGLHAALWVWAGLLQPSLESWSTAFSARVHAELMHVEMVELAKPAPPPPPSAPTPPVPPTATPTKSTPQRETARPPPPAQAGAIVAQAVDPQAPVDLTGETFVTGTADAYAGGVTATAGTGKEAVFTTEPASPTPGKQEDKSKAVSLDEADWACPWPRDAEAEDISEQVVVMKVVVKADGAVESVRLVSDPGHGFGQAAVTCATTTRFEAARDREGRAVASVSPPLRVRFTR